MRGATAALIMMLPVAALCEDRVTVEFPSRDAVDTKRIGPLPSQVRYLTGVKWDSRQDQYVAPVVQAARAAYYDYFRCPLSEAVQTTLVPIQGEQMLAARWRTSCGGSVSEVLLWDEPELSTYFFRLPRDVFENPDLLASTVSNLFIWEETMFRSIRFSIVHDLSAKRSIGYGKPQLLLIPHQFDRPFLVAVWLQEDPTAAWLSVTLSKEFIRHYPRDMEWIPERFPPLRVRAGQWSTGRLMKELSDGGNKGLMQRELREEVLLRELFYRDVGEQELLSLAQMPGLDLDKVLTNALEGGRGPRYRPVFVKLLQSLPHDAQWTPMKGSAPPIDTLLGVMKRAPDVDLVPEVLEYLRQGHVAQGVLSYLADRISSPTDAREFVQLISKMRGVDKDRDRFLDFAHDRIRRRIGLP